MFVVEVRGRAEKAFVVGGLNVYSCRYEMEAHKLLKALCVKVLM